MLNVTVKIKWPENTKIKELHFLNMMKLMKVHEFQINLEKIRR